MRIAVVLGAVLMTSLAGAGCGSAAADPLTGTSWELTSIQSMAPDEQPSTTIDDPATFTVTFGDDGRAAFKVAATGAPRPGRPNPAVPIRAA